MKLKSILQLYKKNIIYIYNNNGINMNTLKTYNCIWNIFQYFEYLLKCKKNNFWLCSVIFIEELSIQQNFYLQLNIKENGVCILYYITTFQFCFQPGIPVMKHTKLWKLTLKSSCLDCASFISGGILLQYIALWPVSPQ